MVGVPLSWPLVVVVVVVEWADVTAHTLVEKAVVWEDAIALVVAEMHTLALHTYTGEAERN